MHENTLDEDDRCAWCDEPILDGNFAKEETFLFVNGEILKSHWNYYHWTPEQYMNETSCLWHHQQ